MTLTKKLIVSAALSSLALAGLVMAQGRMKADDNKQSPITKTEADFGGSKVLIEYNAPSVRGRKIFGEHEAYGKVWRTGADAATTLTTPVDLTIGSLQVPAGVYSIYSVPGATEWELVINKQVGQWGTEYDKAKDLGRTPMKVAKLSAVQEKLQIALEKKGAKSGELHIRWENTDASVLVKAK